jgi:hypothetical protein
MEQPDLKQQRPQPPPLVEQTGDEQARPGQSPRPPLPLEWAVLWTLGLALIFAVSRQSLWIDEFCTVVPASQSTLRGCWRVLFAALQSDVQMPVYMLSMWGWVKVAGDGEWALRAAGLLWLAPGLVAMASGFPRPAQRVAVMLVAATNAFAWYYAGEARPYAMQFGASCLMFGALHRLGRDELGRRRQSWWLTGFLFGFLTLCGSSLIGVIWSIAALAAVFVLIPRRRLVELWKTARLRLALAGVLLLVLGLYYLWTLSLGARATAVATTNWKTVVFVLYEQFGLTGLGPGRADLRQAGMQTLRPYLLPLAGYGLLSAIVLAGGVREVLRPEPAKRVRALALAVALPALLLLGVGVAAHFRVLGRHCTPLMPIWIGLLGLGLAALWGRVGGLGRAVVAAYLIFGLCSCLSIRLAVRHQRDDYRDAARTANTALGQNQAVWWNADDDGARYYQTPLDTDSRGGKRATLIINPTAAFLAGQPKPDVVIASKADIYDHTGALAEYLTHNHYQVSEKLPAFTIWRPAR